MRRMVWGIVIASVLGAAGWWGYTYFVQTQAAEEAERAAEAALQEEEQAQIIWASGKLTPVLWASLGPGAAGVVQTLHVTSGAWVEAGALLMELENGVLAGQVAMAEAAVQEAEAALARLAAAASEADVAAAEAAVAAAKAQVAVAGAALLELDSSVAAARAQVAQAQAQYAEIASHPTEQERVAARAAIAQAEAGLKNAQAGYNLVRDDPEIGALPQSLALAQATANLEAANAQQAAVLQGPTQPQLAVAARAIDTAKAGVSTAESRAPGAEANIRAALAQLSSAQASLDKLLAGASQEELAMAEARVASAQAALDSAEAQLRLTQVRAPFAGQVGTIQVHVGEALVPGTSAILLGDTRRMHVETTDLRETDVIHVQVGLAVEVTFDALPDRVFAGRVTEVAPVSSAVQGSTNYTVYVDVEQLDPVLRWGMTAFVNIQP